MMLCRIACAVLTACLMLAGSAARARPDVAKTVNGKLTIVNVTRYAAEEVNPPEGVKSEDWIRSGFLR